MVLLHTTTGYEADDFIAAAAELGVDVILGNNHCHRLDDPWGDGAIPLRFREPEKAAAKIVAAARTLKVDAIVAIGDRPLQVAALAAQELGLPHNPPEAVAACRDKHLARQRLREAGLPAPWFERVPVDSEPTALARRIPYPCVLKPLALSASRGVIRANNAYEFGRAFLRLRRLLTAPELRVERNPLHDDILIEGYIHGDEVAVEGVLDRGRLQTLAIFDKPDPLVGPFFAETIYVTPSRLPPRRQTTVETAVAAGAAALGLVQGPIHAELRMSPEGPVLLEIAARSIGGLCSRVLRFGSGMRLEEIVLRHALGMALDAPERECGAAAVMMIPVPRSGNFRGIRGVAAARTLEGIDDLVITAKVGQTVQPLPEGNTYIGFIFARGADPATAEARIRQAYAQLDIDIRPELGVVRNTA